MVREPYWTLPAALFTTICSHSPSSLPTSIRVQVFFSVRVTDLVYGPRRDDYIYHPFSPFSRSSTGLPGILFTVATDPDRGPFLQDSLPKTSAIEIPTTLSLFFSTRLLLSSSSWRIVLHLIFVFSTVVGDTPRHPLRWPSRLAYSLAYAKTQPSFPLALTLVSAIFSTNPADAIYCLF